VSAQGAPAIWLYRMIGLNEQSSWIGYASDARVP
jgi:hypothetical protein